eukprot:TRINITY_DN3093_c0_g1_i1.p2 TRINITY_DN3093_c0_g1~~TRINITY_DN3093_c0_g1_i1.p2  ORF type:complete len:162 (-),score=38.53 TRINITY_DN3093_c0_g1_i1:240-725(-)
MRPSVLCASKDIVQTLLRSKVSVPTAVSEVLVAFSAKGAGQAGARHFIREHFPALKFHNPTVTFKATRSLEPKTPVVTLKYKDGASKDYEVASRVSGDILKLFTEGNIPDPAPPAEKPKRVANLGARSVDAKKSSRDDAPKPWQTKKRAAAKSAETTQDDA